MIADSTETHRGRVDQLTRTKKFKSTFFTEGADSKTPLVPEGKEPGCQREKEVM